MDQPRFFLPRAGYQHAARFCFLAERLRPLPQAKSSDEVVASNLFPSIYYVRARQRPGTRRADERGLKQAFIPFRLAYETHGNRWRWIYRIKLCALHARAPRLSHHQFRQADLMPVT